MHHRSDIACREAHRTSLLPLPLIFAGTAILLLLGCSLHGQSELAAGCLGVDRSLTVEQRKAETLRIAHALRRDPASLTVERVMRQGSWTAVWATPDDLEAGVFFLRRGAEPELVEIWGGVATPGERDEIARWARKLPGGPPAELSRCFAAAVTGGQKDDERE